MSSDDFHALKIFISSPVNTEMIHALVNCTLKVLPGRQHAQQQSGLPSPPASPAGCASFSAAQRSQLPSLFTFITRLVKYTNVFTGTLMATLVYLRKLAQKLPPCASAQDETSRHRIFLSCLILSAKFHNDASPKNKHWAKYTDGIFSTSEINQMERQLLYLLDWDIAVSNYDLYHVLHDFLVPIKVDLKNLQKYKLFLKKQQQLQHSQQLQQHSQQLPQHSQHQHQNGFPKSKSLPYLNTSQHSRAGSHPYKSAHQHNSSNYNCPRSAGSNTTQFPRPSLSSIKKCPSLSQIKSNSNPSSYRKKTTPCVSNPAVAVAANNVHLNAVNATPLISRNSSTSSSCYSSSDDYSNPVSATSTTFGFASSTSSNSSSVVPSPPVVSSEYPSVKLNLIDGNYYYNDYSGAVFTESKPNVTNNFTGNSYSNKSTVMNIQNSTFVYDGNVY